MSFDDLDIKSIRASLEELRAKLAQLRGHL
jgi:hypothetical protein